MPKPRLLVVDDEPSLRLLLQITLERAGYAVDIAADGIEASRLIGQKPFDLVISDLAMPGADGLDVLNAATHVGVPVLLCSAYQTEDVRKRAIELGARMILDKPVLPQTLLDAVKSALAEDESA